MRNIPKVNGQNILDIIKYLYKKRLQQTPDSTVIESWSNLDDESARMHLQKLFQNWNYSADQMDQELESYFVSEAINEASEREEYKRSMPNDEYAAPPISPPEESQYQQAEFQEASYIQEKPKKSFKTLWILLLLPLLAIAGYVLFQLQEFKTLGYLYVTTDNVAIRDAGGVNIGRMDIFAGKNSVSFLRTTDKQTYPIQIGDKQYECRRVVFDSTSFQDFLFQKPTAFGYVNENYVIDDKENFILYRNVFKSVNTVAAENSNLTSAYRKVIIGSLRQNPSLESLFVQVPCTSSAKTTSGILKLKKDNFYQVVAKLSDGKYYIFAGDPKAEIYEAPRPLNYIRASDQSMIPFANENLIFKLVDQGYFLYDCKGTALDYYLEFDSQGKITFAKYVDYL